MSILTKKISHRVSNYKQKLLTEMFIDYNLDYKKSLFLAGSGRSGTTWLSEVINYKNEYRYIFEPFWGKEVSECKEFNDSQYIRPGNKEERFLQPIKAILSGKIRNKWTDKFNRRFISDRRLIKDIRANLFLRWLYETFPGIPIILIFRHPCAVASSGIKCKWKIELNKYLAQAELIEDFLSPFRAEIENSQKLYESSGNSFENSIFNWCIENYVPLKQFKTDEIYLAFYENFSLNPEDEVKKLFAFLGKQYDENIFAVLKKPSALVQKQSAILSGRSLVDSWKRHISDAQIRRATEILSLFGLEKIYSHDSMPRIDNLSQLMKT